MKKALDLSMKKALDLSTASSCIFVMQEQLKDIPIAIYAFKRLSSLCDKLKKNSSLSESYNTDSIKQFCIRTINNINELNSDPQNASLLGLIELDIKCLENINSLGD